METKFNHLRVPEHWEQYWSKYPQGYTILEALINWVSQVDKMVDNINDWNKYLGDFVKTFDKNLQDKVRVTLREMEKDGTLAKVINETIFGELNDRIRTIEIIYRWQKGGLGADDVVSLIAGYAGNAIASDIRGGVIGGGGGIGYENVIGSKDIDNVGTTNPKRANLLESNAHYAAILAGYDNIVNALAGVLTGYHCYIAQEATHGTISGGSYHKILDGDYSAIGGGTQNLIDILDGGGYGFIGAGSTNKIHGKYASIISGYLNRIGVAGNLTGGKGSFIGSGELNTVDGQYAHIVSGQECKATKDYSSANGRYAVANNVGERAFSSGRFKTTGDSGQSTLHGMRQTTDALANQLLLDFENKVPFVAMGNNTALLCSGKIVGYRVDAPGSCAFDFEVLFMKRTGSATIEASNVRLIHKSDNLYDMDFSIANNQPQIRVKGVAGHTINWTARINTEWTRDV